MYKRKWTIQDSEKLYSIAQWGKSYFKINQQGHLMVYPKSSSTRGIDLKKVIDEIKKQGLSFPVLIRFQDIIRDRVQSLNQAFLKSIAEHSYQGSYRGVYPIKVNQMREVVEEILDAGEPYHFGLEAGSKAELVVVLAMRLSPQALIICNGYKDNDFIQMALLGVQLGKQVILVVEKLSELVKIIKLSQKFNVKPLLGIRSKLYSKGTGRWESSGGEFAKFGLTPAEILEAIQILKKANMEDTFKLLHFHLGSQITNIASVKDAVKEASRIYAKLIKLGLSLEYLDVGGGLAVDYDGSQTNFNSSMNYTLDQYVNDVVYSIQEVCHAENVKEPHIVSESGRALVAHHSVLIMNVFGAIQPACVASAPLPVALESEDDVVRELRDILTRLEPHQLSEHFQDAVDRKNEAFSKFKLGYLSLQDMAAVEILFSKICDFIYEKMYTLEMLPEEAEEIKNYLADQYLCNFSIFQSMPDHWAISHLFPIMPIHRLQEQPSRNATLVDITCDSDGKICKFIDLQDVRSTLRLHTLDHSKPYYLGVFLMGAYQDIMGDLHNLFGRVNEVHVFLDETEKNGYYIEEIIFGNKISEVLSMIQYNPTSLSKKLKNKIERQVRVGAIKPKEGVELQSFYEKVLNGYTYLN